MCRRRRARKEAACDAEETLILNAEEKSDRAIHHLALIVGVEISHDDFANHAY